MKKYLKEKWEDIIWEIGYKWDAFANIPWRIKTRILIIWHWLPIIWNDYDWDFSFTLVALRHKIKRSRLRMNKSTFKGVTWPKNYKRMLECEILLDRIIDDDFAPEDNKEWHEKYPWELNFKTDENGRSYMPTMEGKQKEEFWKLQKKKDMLEKEANDRLFYLIRRYYRGRWD